MSYEVAFIGTFEDAKDYDTALREARQLAAGIGYTEHLLFCAITEYDTDNEGQRVVYLPPEPW